MFMSVVVFKQISRIGAERRAQLLNSSDVNLKQNQIQQRQRRLENAQKFYRNFLKKKKLKIT